MRIAIPRSGESVAPCFEHSATITIFDIEGDQVVGQTDFSLATRVAFDRVRLLRDQGVDTLICGGVQERFEDMVQAHDIHVISWVSGEVEEILRQFIRGDLVPGSGRLGDRDRDPGKGGRSQP